MDSTELAQTESKSSQACLLATSLRFQPFASQVSSFQLIYTLLLESPANQFYTLIVNININLVISSISNTEAFAHFLFYHKTFYAERANIELLLVLV